MTAPFDAAVNASPLIFLGKLGSLDILPEPVATTPTVLDEIRAGDPAEYAEIDLVDRVVDAGRILEVEADPDILPSEMTGLDSGEASVLALAIAHDLDQVIIDDRVAIRAARAFGLEPSSTPFLLLRACRDGQIEPERFTRKLDRLMDLGYFLSGKLYERLRRAARGRDD